jgi:hypothetical protein
MVWSEEHGKNFWWRWFDRLADYCKRKFGPDWQKEHGFKVRLIKYPQIHSEKSFL